MYDTAEEPKGILLVAAYCGVEDQIDNSQGPEGLCLQTADGKKLQSFNAICRFLATCSQKSKQLLGDTHTDRAMVCQYDASLAAISKSKISWVYPTMLLLPGARVAFVSEHRATGAIRGCNVKGQSGQQPVVSQVQPTIGSEHAYATNRLTSDFRPRCTLLECLSALQIW